MGRRHRSAWSEFFRMTHNVYRAQRAARTYRAWTSGSPKRVFNLYARRATYRLFSRFTNRWFR